jgi:hypothetical protein
MKGRMFIRTPSLMSGSQPSGCSCSELPAHEDVVGGLTLEPPKAERHVVRQGSKGHLSVPFAAQLGSAVPAAWNAVLAA